MTKMLIDLGLCNDWEYIGRMKSHELQQVTYEQNVIPVTETP